MTIDRKENDIILSICIPTFGGSDRLEEGLQRIFSYQGDDLEVVISDNDNTGKIQEILKGAEHDKRLHYYSNEMNYGPKYNWIKVLTYGRGKYLLTLNDNDWIVPDKIPEIISFLKMEESSVIVGYPIHNGKITYTTGAKNGYSCTGEETHPSCFMIKNEKFCMIKDVLSLKERIDAYVQCSLALICSKNDKVCINRKISIIEMPDENYYITHVARSTKEQKTASGGFFYTPSGALTMLKGYIEICKTYYSDCELKRLIPYLYKAQLKRATVEYKVSSVSKVMTARYGLPYRTDINLNQERKLFYKSAKSMLQNENYLDGNMLITIWIFTLCDKWNTNIKLLRTLFEKIIYYCLERYSWAKLIQKYWRKIKINSD